MTTLNLDQKAAQYAQQIIKVSIAKSEDAKSVENLVTKALGVLQEQGVYALILFLYSRTGKEEKLAPHIREKLYSLLKVIPALSEIGSIPDDSRHADVLKYYSDHVCEDLYTLLFVKDLYEQTLIYARYGAKAEGKSEGKA